MSMKKIHIWVAVMLLAAPCHAQLLKNLMSNMKSNLSNKVAPTGKTDSASHSHDSTYMTQLLAKAAKPRPSISPADSAAAIKGFMTGTGGSGSLYQYRLTYTLTVRKKDSTVTDTVSTAITDTHNARSDMGFFGGKMYVLGHAAMPRYSVFLFPDSKTYTLNIIDTAALSSAGGITYQVTRVGTETTQGYSCIHSKMTTLISGKPETTMDIWTSNDVPGYALIKSVYTVRNMTPKMIQVLDQAGCGGMFVRMSMHTSSISMDMVLIGAGRKNFPDSMFQIPGGYKEGRGMMGR